ncbi:MAG TPA: patatin-like phospholipase family protein [Bryobacteraceae bacterium]|nr:patatin-like phospholipase family protein [Bryobacteraceae bacterium]
MGARALVLGGGGPVGIAWESGLIAGLAEAGIDLSAADFIIGTSAGSFVGAYIAAGTPPTMLAAPFLGEAGMPKSASELLSSPPDLTVLMAKMMESFAGVRPNDEVCREIGQWALASAAMSEDAYLGTFGKSLAPLLSGGWPGKNYTCPAVDTATGVPVEWNKDSGVDLLHAIASSCAVPGIYPPVTIQGRRYMDGGMRSPTNADLVKGCEKVVVIAVARADAPPVFSRPLERELNALRESGSQVELIRPNAECLEAFGANLMDASRRPAAAAAGLKQGRAGIEALRAFWK